MPDKNQTTPKETRSARLPFKSWIIPALLLTVSALTFRAAYNKVYHLGGSFAEVLGVMALGIVLALIALMMIRFELHKKNAAQNPTAKNIANANYETLPELAAILTNSDGKAMADIRQLATNYAAFIAEHQPWCDAMEYGRDRQKDTLQIFAYWLAGHAAVDSATPPKQFGAYIDWKEATEDILWQLNEAGKNLGYKFSLETIPFDGSESTAEALLTISEFLKKRDLTLVYLNTYSDCYHLFIIRSENQERLLKLAEKPRFRFQCDF